MKYYKRIKHSGCPAFEVDKIYPENYKQDYYMYVEDSVETFPERWQEVTPAEYYVQEGKMPKYFAIKRVEDNPLWGKYIDWLNNTYNKQYFGDREFDGTPKFWASLGRFKTNTIELTLEQWDQIVNKNVMEEKKEIIGWKLKEDCKQYKQAVLSMLGVDEFNPIYDNCDLTVQWSISIIRNAGVLELWFKPVYKEKTLQFGGYDVIFEKVTSGVRITCNGETGTFSQIEAIYNYFKPNSTYFKFGSQEVKRVEYSSGAAWNLEYENEAAKSIKIGCTTGTWGEFVAIYEKAKSML